MSFIKMSITEDLGSIENELIKSFDEMFRMVRPRFNPCEHIWSPHVDIYEASGEIIALVDVAGVKKEHIHVEIGRRTLKISGVRKERSISKQTRYRLAEISYGYFERNLSLSAQVDPDTSVASYVDGLLQITMPKLSLNHIHKIPIQTV